MVKTFMNEMEVEHSGAVAFEYIIILVIMAVVIFAAWNALGDVVKAKATEIASFISNNGQSGLTGTGGTRG